MTDKIEKSYVAILNNSSGNFLMLTRDKDKVFTILAWLTLSDALAYFEKGYNSCHARGTESSGSAVINNIFFNPKIFEFNGLQDMIDKLKLTPHEKPCRIGNVSGFYDVLKLNDDAVKLLEDKAIKPRLISDPSVPHPALLKKD